MNRLRTIMAIGLTVCIASCGTKGPPSGYNVGGGGTGSDRVAYQNSGHNTLYAIAAWEVDAKNPVLMIFRIEDLSTGLPPLVDKGQIIGDDHRRGVKIMDNARKNTWVEIVYDDSPQTITIFGESRTLQDGRIFIIDTVDATSNVTQLDGSIPFEIPQDVVDGDNEPINVLFTVQDLAEKYAALKDFLSQHKDTIEYLNDRRTNAR